MAGAGSNALSDPELAALLRRAGVPAGQAAILTAVAHPESGAVPDTIQQGQPYATTGWGLWQITPGNSEPQFGINHALLDPVANADAAAAKLRSQGLSAWTTFNDGAYKFYLPDAQQAVSMVYHASPSEVNRLVQLAEKGQAGVQPGGISGWLADLNNVLKQLILGPLGLVGQAASTGEAITGLANAFTTFTRIVSDFEHGVAWLFVPSHWVRVFAFLAGGAFIVVGITAMTRTGRGQAASIAGA